MSSRCGRSRKGVSRQHPRPPPEPLDVEPIRLEPCPDALLEGLPATTPGPDPRYEGRESMSLPFVAGLQRLPPLERATVVLRDVLGFTAAEVADILDTSEGSISIAIERARSALESLLPEQGGEPAPPPGSESERELMRRFAEAFEARDLERLAAVLTDGVQLTMPPAPIAYEGHEAIGRFLETRSFWSPAARVRLVATRANGQPAFAYYVGARDDELLRAHGLLVLTLQGDRVSAVARFGESIHSRFGLPLALRV
jgi:RNA polymerase sigma-70 factor (TIGR02960 family)